MSTAEAPWDENSFYFLPGSPTPNWLPTRGMNRHCMMGMGPDFYKSWQCSSSYIHVLVQTQANDKLKSS